MQVTETLSDGLKRAFAVVVPAADIELRRATRLGELAKQVNLPGFRPGKVPMPIVRQRFGGAVASEVMEQSINEAAQKLIADRALRPAMTPKLEMVTLEPAAPGPAKDLEFTLEMEVLPEIPLPDFSTVTLTRHIAKVPAEEVETAIAEIAARNRELAEIPAEELAARATPGAIKGDVLTVDYLGKIDDVAFDGGTGTDTDVDIGGSGFIPGFAEQIEGMSPGDTRTIHVTFPEEYGAKELAGKAAAFEIVAKQLRKAVPAVLDDTLAEKLGFSNLDDLRGVLTRMRQQRLDGLSRVRLKRDLLDALAERATFDPPEVLAEQEFNQIWQNLETSRANNTLDEDDKAKPEDVLRAEYRTIAVRRVRLGLLLGEIGRSNNIGVSDDELTMAIRAEAAKYQGREAQMMEFYRAYPAAAESLRGPIFEDKVVDYVIDLATVAEADISVADLEKDLQESAAAPTAALPSVESASAELSDAGAADPVSSAAAPADAGTHETPAGS